MRLLRAFPASGRAVLAAASGLALAAVAFVLPALGTDLPGHPIARADAAPAACSPNIYVNTGTAPFALIDYAPDGTLLNSVPLATDYGDIAFSADGSTLYATGLAEQILDTIDPATGAVTRSIPLTGGPADLQPNALSALPDGRLLLGAATDGLIWAVDPATGALTPWIASFPANYVSSGDFLALPDGDVLALGLNITQSPITTSTVFRIAPDGTVTPIGSVPFSLGAAQANGRIYLAGNDGALRELDALPTSGPSFAALPTTTVATNADALWGATSTGDAGRCPALTATKVSSPASGETVKSGETVTYTLTFDNSNSIIAAAVDHTDTLADVVDDATVVDAPSVGSGAALTVSAISGGAFTVTGLVPAGQISTVTYSVAVDTAPAGNGVLNNYLTAAGTAAPATCATTDTACTTNPVSVTPPPPGGGNGGGGSGSEPGTGGGTPIPPATTPADTVIATGELAATGSGTDGALWTGVLFTGVGLAGAALVVGNRRRVRLGASL